MTWFRYVFVLLFTSLLFSGCAAKMAYKRGLDWETQGQMYRAGQEFVASLNRKGDKPEVLAALKRVAEPGYNEGLQLATVAQNNADFPKALSYYRQLKSYTGGLSRHGVLTFAIIDIDTYIEDMAIAAATERYKKGKRNLENGKYAEAIKHFEAALGFKKDFADAADLIAKSHYLWGESLLADNKYHAAAQRFENAHKSLKGGYLDALDRAAGVYYTIGSFYTQGGYCQAGWKELKKAKGLVATPKIKAANKAAKDCAIHDVAVVVLTDGAKNAAAGVHVESILGERLAAAGATLAENEQYATVSALSLRSRDVRRGQNIFAHVAVRPFERLVLPSVQTVDIRRSGWTYTKRQAQANMWDRCPAGPGLCETPVTVSYTENVRTVTMTMTGDVVMLNASSGSEDWHYDFTRANDQKVMYADKFLVDEIAVTVGTEKALGVVVLDKTIRSLANGSRVAKFGEMSGRTIDMIVSDSAKTLVEKAAFEPKVPALPMLVMESIH
jgi:tetratricopeptide (TPR) repeat protein